MGITDELSNFNISKVREKHVFKKFGDLSSNIQIYKVKVKNIKEATELVEGFDEKVELRRILPLLNGRKLTPEIQ